MIVANWPPMFYEALTKEGFEIPRECGDMRLEIPVEGVYQMHYVVNLTIEDLAKIGRALISVARTNEERMNEEKNHAADKSVLECTRTPGHDGPCNGWPCASTRARVTKI